MKFSLAYAIFSHIARMAIAGGGAWLLEKGFIDHSGQEEFYSATLALVPLAWGIASHWKTQGKISDMASYIDQLEAAQSQVDQAAAMRSQNAAQAVQQAADGEAPH